MGKYELVLLLDSRLTSKEREDFFKKLEEWLSQNDRKILDKDDIGVLQLKYGLNDNKERNKAYFVSYLLELEEGDVKELLNLLKYNKVVWRKFIYKYNKSQEFFKFKELNKKLEDIISKWGNQKYGQRVTFFTKKENLKYITWKALPILKKYTTRFGDIKPRKYTGNSVKVQKKLRKAIIRARELGLLEYIKGLEKPKFNY